MAQWLYPSWDYYEMSQVLIKAAKLYVCGTLKATGSKVSPVFVLRLRPTKLIREITGYHFLFILVLVVINDLTLCLLCVLLFLFCYCSVCRTLSYFGYCQLLLST